MPAINGAKYLGSNDVLLPKDYDLGDYSGRIVSIRQAEKLGYWSEAIQKIKSGRPSGVKNFVGRAYNANDIRRIFGRIDLSVVRAAARAAAVSREAIAKEMLGRVVANHEFNSYTGNLLGSYMATIVSGRKVTARLVNYVERNTVHHGPKGGRYATLMGRPKRGGVKPFVFKSKKKNKRYKPNPKHLTRNGNYIRYLKKYEKDVGYERNSLVSANHNISVGQFNNQDLRLQSAIIIENTAPYSSAVQHRVGNRVIQGAMTKMPINSWKNKTAQLVRVATIKAIKESGIKIR